MDAALQRAADGALDTREGTIIVLDAQTGRVRASVNSRLAEEAAFPPGSTIKPFTLLAALRARVINADAHLSCRKHYTRHGADFTCSHPVYNPPFDSAEALAHSCNYYFARLAERLPPDEFNQTLAAYGFGAHANTAPTTIKANVVAAAPPAAAAVPRLSRGRWQVSTALGEGGELLVTPAQLIAAYAALFNGGHLYQPQESEPENFRPQETAQLSLSPEVRTLLLSGLRGAVRYGTASPADLASLPSHVFGKTGTATELDGIHTHGWFVGFASERAADSAQAVSRGGDELAPAEVKLAVLVFLKRGQGKQSAELARPVFAEHARLTLNAASNVPHSNAVTSTSDAENFNRKPRASNGAVTLVRVRLAREEVTRSLSLDDYIFGVLAAEASVENEFAALKAQAVVSRTYALGNLRRHARDGYDFCNTTHCQRFLQVTGENARPDFHELVRRAVGDTNGEVLRDGRGSLAAGVFFSTSCGGQTANIQSLWGTPAREPYLRGVRDEYCNAMPHSHWTDVLPAARLAKALREDERTDVGARVDELAVVKRDATGRVEQLAIAGARRRVVVRGWDFKIVVGRTLGWSVLKSSRFDVRRAGDKFVFHGSGFGHGLGLCQSGAHVMAARGSSYRQILAYYFPATTTGGMSTDAETKRAAHSQQGHAQLRMLKINENAAPRNALGRAATFAHADVIHASFAHANFAAPRARARLTLSSANFRVSYPARNASNARREVEAALAALEAVRADVRARLAMAALAMPALGVLEVTAHETTGDFTGATGKPAWVAATTTRGHRIDLQPLATLRKRGVLEPTLRHEYAHAVINSLSHGGRAPLWLTEGLAAHVANEGALLMRFESKRKISLADLERRLAEPASSAADMRALYAAAFREVNTLIRAEGEANVWRRVAHT